ncbi:TetR/AcrR family transcriptional regulator [Paenibacillus hodogayensis]|uniref:TetR/AcrR family transcriptional regulator n=1 Tax=Paenibacillus hodogayensis TaxID=279208 RepID=A0ABV5W0S4_9BACL
MKQEERRQQTLQLLLSTVKELIHEKGCDEVKMSDIMERSGLSKGAIFHYVKTKDELFALILQERLDDIDARFNERVDQEEEREFQGPLKEITRKLSALDDSEETTNQIILYLLGKSSQPVVAAALRDFHESSFQLARQWIVTGQNHGVIPAAIDADRTAELFILVSHGLRMRTAIQAGTPSFTSDDFAAFLAHTLNPPASS